MRFSVNAGRLLPTDGLVRVSLHRWSMNSHGLLWARTDELARLIADGNWDHMPGWARTAMRAMSWQQGLARKLNAVAELGKSGSHRVQSLRGAALALMHRTRTVLVYSSFSTYS